MGGLGDLACDLETVVSRSNAAWRDLLGPDGLVLADRISRDCLEKVVAARTRMWTAIECLKKTGLPLESPLVLESITADGWVLLRSGRRTIATCATTVQGLETPIIIAVAVPCRAENEPVSATVPVGI